MLLMDGLHKFEACSFLLERVVLGMGRRCAFLEDKRFDRLHCVNRN